MFTKSSKISIIHVILFFSTVVTTLLAGAIMQGANILANPATILQGAPFSVTLMLILGTHEFGHYYFARNKNFESIKYRVNREPQQKDKTRKEKMKDFLWC